MKTRKNPREEDVPKIDITGRTNVQKNEEQSREENLEEIEKKRRSKLN